MWYVRLRTGKVAEATKGVVGFCKGVTATSRESSGHGGQLSRKRVTVRLLGISKEVMLRLEMRLRKRKKKEKER
jgi:hypothetical protein